MQERSTGRKKGSLVLMDRCKGALCLLVGKVAMKYVTVLL